MTRDTKTLSAVFMAVLLVLASGTAVSLAVTSSPTDAGTNAVGVQETTTAADGEANITINEQESSGEQIVVESATLPEGGFIAIHDSSVAEAPLSSVLGNSVYLEAGTHENVTITLARPITESQTLVAMPHLDTNNNEVYDFVLSTGELDGPYTTDGQVLIDQANVTVAQETTTTTEEVEETTTTEEAVEETTTTTTEEEVEETTTTEEAVEETTTTTTEEEVEETTTTTEEEVIEETTTEEVVGETTTTGETPADMQRFVFKIEQMQIDRWSFVVGDEETPDRTQRVGNLTISDRRVTINLSKLLRQGAMAQQQAGPMTTVSPEQAEEIIEENLSKDLQTVRYVITDVSIENVTFVVTAPEDIEMPEPPMTTTTAEPEETTTTEEVEETTTTEEEVEETTTTEDVVEETTTTEEVEETTTTEEIEETTTTEEVEETTTTEEVEETTTTEEVEETTTTEEVEETTTTEDVVEETTTTAEDGDVTAAELSSFEVSGLDAPDSATTGDTITVSATVSNPNDQQATQEVAFRLEGTVIARQNVTLDAGEQTTVEFEIDTEGVPARQYIHGVYTRNFGELGVIVLEDSSQATTTAAAGNETTTSAA
ncbi:hypothetical protein M0R88_05060 [Halorussus gelatinilyticus]|uniref:DUF7282 domain-containing protein n=1 Tax=Halorussus gelatinilyticus TaxID=2937524 RepID=A0A8U0ILE9_9EURY|nr:hypothetical protein [Halorussus gelatinilyticus]UPW01475.1 hypothetical protein M0R88_05060 [Halorussus gelatinilyticus]